MQAAQIQAQSRIAEKKIQQVNAQIEALTAGEVQAAVEKALKTALTLVARGGEVNTLPSYDRISAKFA